MSQESEIVTTQTKGSGVPLPLPRTPITIRPGTLDDLPFIDSLQKLHTKQVGWFPTKAIEGKIGLGHVLIAEEVGSGQCAVGSEETAPPTDPALPTAHDSTELAEVRPQPTAYLIGNDQYFKRDDVGIIYQINVAPGRQRGLVGAALLRAQFERSAYGCRLYCCWCAQDIEANQFWESMGFVPLAFRAGSRTKGKDAAGKNAPRVHIFWQRRIRSGDSTTPFWFPSQTTSGSIREDRLVLPIPPGTHWRDAKPLVLPGDRTEDCGLGTESKALKRLPGIKRNTQSSVLSPQSSRCITAGGLRFEVPGQAVVVASEKAKRQPRQKVKNDPRYVAAARELRDRWLERINTGRVLVDAKYDVSRPILTSPIPEHLSLPLAA